MTAQLTLKFSKDHLNLFHNYSHPYDEIIGLYKKLNQLLDEEKVYFNNITR